MAPEILAGAAGLAAAAAVGCAGAAAVVGLAAGGAVGAAAGAVVALAGAAGCVLVAPPHAALSKTALAPSALIRNSRRVFICSTYQSPLAVADMSWNESYISAIVGVNEARRR